MGTRTQGMLLGMGIAIAVLASFMVGRLTSRPQRIYEERVDTLVIRDTMTAYEPIYVTRRVMDTILIPVTDTLRVTDTLFVFLEREQIRWEDSLSVIYASGVRPHIDSVVHYMERMVVTDTRYLEVERRTRWGIGVQLGGGLVCANGKVSPVPYVGIGLSYDLLSW